MPPDLTLTSRYPLASTWSGSSTSDGFCPSATLPIGSGDTVPAAYWTEPPSSMTTWRLLPVCWTTWVICGPRPPQGRCPPCRSRRCCRAAELGEAADRDRPLAGLVQAAEEGGRRSAALELGVRGAGVPVGGVERELEHERARPGAVHLEHDGGRALGVDRDGLRVGDRARLLPVRDEARHEGGGGRDLQVAEGVRGEGCGGRCRRSQRPAWPWTGPPSRGCRPPRRSARWTSRCRRSGTRGNSRWRP
jgi:hypothetical protein